ncbi:DoxX family protein [Chitinophaga agrisoli]|uniref:DoxX family protein n=1 Tax=Chitinophaga agrisoli TaxID=2607653 RepID=A0A5B2VVN2_9BACT|nr:DoxX family protein [Chitinophaga agrisoli]KAA2242784.1 DoxX family protein [Chitinophaga agrisoli]
MESTHPSRAIRWTGIIMRWFVILFLLFDAVMKFVKPAPVIQSTIHELGYKEHHILIFAFLVLLPTLLFAIPRTRILGALLLTAYLGGAIAAQLRVDSPLFSHLLFPVYIAVLMWGSIWLLDERLRRIFPVIKN